MVIRFTVGVMPVAQARPRFFVRRTGNVTRIGAYDPAHCKTFKEIVAWHARMEALSRDLMAPLQGPIAISLTFRLGAGKEAYHTKRPDIDNLAKGIKDALRGVLYADDSQIVEAHLYKQYGGPEVVITLRAYEGTKEVQHEEMVFGGFGAASVPVGHC